MCRLSEEKLVHECEEQEVPLTALKMVLSVSYQN